MRRASLFLLVTAALAQACSCDRVPEGAVTTCEQAPPVPTSVRTDILFVIDDSQSMQEEQDNLRTNLGNFSQGLKDSPVANDFQVGVTTTSVANFANTLTGAQGRLIGTPAVLDGASATLVADFQARIATVTTSGSGKEQPFRAMRLALSSPLIDAGQPNEGLLRPGARLAVVFLSDEDDCSESSANLANSNNKCHNDNNDGINYKAQIDSVASFVTFLSGPIGGEVRDVALGAIVGVDGGTKSPTCGDTSNRWCCGSSSNNTCVANTCGANVLTIPAASSLTSDTWCCGGATGTACTSTCDTAFDKADRFETLLAGFLPDRTLTASICDASFADTLTQLACMLVPQDVPLDGAPADWRMMTVGLVGGGVTTPCEVTIAGSANEATADAVYEPASGGQPPMLHFQNGCRLGCGKRIEINLICAG